MVTDKEINEQAEDFLNAMAPKPVPPPSRAKKDTVHNQQELQERVRHQNPKSESEDLSSDEQSFLMKYLTVSSGIFSESSSKHVLIDSRIHERLSRFVKITGKGRLVNLLNNILLEFITEHEPMFQSILSKLINKKF